MQTKKRKSPSLRFRGYTDDWEQRKLGESCRIGDIDHRMPKSVTEGVPYLMTGDFIGENKLNFENTKLVSIEDYDQLSKKIKPEYGDILFARYASVGAVRYVDIQRKFLISYSCAIMKPNIDIKGLFLYQLLQTDFMKRKIEFEINPNSQKNIGIDSLKKLKISIPIIEEQEKIGKFFKDLDNTIALHQRKLDLLKEQKKGFLQKMFPKNGAKIPELRFEGFSDDWEQRQLGEISRMYQPITITGNDLLPDGVPVFGANGFIGFFSEANHIDDQVTISARGEGSGTPSYVHGPVWITGNSMVVNVDDFHIDKYFLFANLTANSLKKFVTGGAQPQLTRDVLVKVPITLPNADEQQKIGSFFKQLDGTIALHQRKLDLLKEQKKGFLQKMFV